MRNNALEWREKADPNCTQRQWQSAADFEEGLRISLDCAKTYRDLSLDAERAAAQPSQGAALVAAAGCEARQPGEEPLF